MNEQDLLFQLIQTLSSEEKRQFTRLAKTNKRDTAYGKLFKALDKLTIYDEKSFKLKHKNAAFIKNFSKNKNKLMDKILDLIVGMNIDESGEAKIKHTLSFLPALYKRKQFGLMRKKINSIKKTAYTFEQFYLLIEVLEWEKKMVWNDVNGNYSNAVEDIIKEQEICIQQLTKQLAYKNLRRRVSILNRKDLMLEKQENIDSFESLMQNELLQDDLKFLSKEAEIHYCHIKINFYRFKQNHEESLAYSKRLLELCENRKKYFPNEYKMALDAYIVSCDTANKFDDYLDILHKLEKVLIAEHSELFAFHRMNFYRLRYYLGTSQFDEAIKIAAKVEDRWLELSPHLTEARYFTFCFNLMMLYWIVGDLEETENWLICILNFSNAESRKDDIGLATKLFSLIFYYEKQEQGATIDYDKKIDSTRKTLKNNKQFQVFHQVVLKHCRDLNRAVTKNNKQEIISSLKCELLEIKIQNPKLLCLEEILLWCRSKLQACSIRGLIGQVEL